MVGATNSSFKPTIAGHYAVILTSINNANCVEASGCRLVQINTGIASVGNSNLALAIFPNPANEFISINSTVMIKAIEVLNVLGQRCVFQSTNNQVPSNMLDVSNLPNGTYLARIQIANETINKTIVIQH